MNNDFVAMLGDAFVGRRASRPGAAAEAAEEFAFAAGMLPSRIERARVEQICACSTHV